MSATTKYIQDEIKKNGQNALVKVILMGRVTEIQAKKALDELHKPKDKRSFGYHDIFPYSEPREEIVIEKTQIVEEPVQVVEEPVEDGSKKKEEEENITNQTDES